MVNTSNNSANPIQCFADYPMIQFFDVSVWDAYFVSWDMLPCPVGNQMIFGLTNRKRFMLGFTLVVIPLFIFCVQFPWHVLCKSMGWGPQISDWGWLLFFLSGVCIYWLVDLVVHPRTFVVDMDRKRLWFEKTEAWWAQPRQPCPHVPFSAVEKSYIQRTRRWWMIVIRLKHSHTKFVVFRDKNRKQIGEIHERLNRVLESGDHTD